MAINFYRQPRVEAPSRTNIVRAQTTPRPTGPASSAGNFRAVDQYFSSAAGAPAPSTLTQAPVVPVRQNLSSTPASTTPPVDIGQIVSDAISGINFGLNWPSVVSGGGTGGSQASIINANTAAGRLAYDVAQAGAASRAAQEAAARARLGTGAQADAIRALLATPTGPGSYREGADTLLGIIAGQERTGRQSIQDQYDAAIRLLGEQYDRANTQTTTGFNALRDYLTANAPTAFATAPTGAAPTATNTLAQFMAGQGVGTQATDAEVAAQNAVAQAGQGNYAGLLDILRRAETAGQASRLAETQMAKTTAGTALDALRAQAGAGLTRQQQTALDTLVTQLTGQRFGVEQGATERRQTLQDALTGLLGTGFEVTGEQIAEDIEENRVPAVAPSKAPKKVSERPLTSDWQRLVAKNHPNFTGTFNQAKKKYPKLYKQFLDSQKKK